MNYIPAEILIPSVILGGGVVGGVVGQKYTHTYVGAGVGFVVGAGATFYLGMKWFISAAHLRD
jgi:Na+/pantothenate symporter